MPPVDSIGHEREATGSDWWSSLDYGLWWPEERERPEAWNKKPKSSQSHEGRWNNKFDIALKRRLNKLTLPSRRFSEEISSTDLEQSQAPEDKKQVQARHKQFICVDI